MKRFNLLLILFFISNIGSAQKTGYPDTPYLQDYSIKYYVTDTTETLSATGFDRNGATTVLSSEGILRAGGGAFQYPGWLRPDRSHRPMADRRPVAVSLHQDQLVFLDNQAVFSNAFAAKWYTKHGLPDARYLALGPDFTSVVSGGKKIRGFKLSELLWERSLGDEAVTDIRYDSVRGHFLLLSPTSIRSLSLSDGSVNTVFQGKDLTCFTVSPDKIFVGTKNGYLALNAQNFFIATPLFDKLPVPEISAIAFINGQLWFGSAMGAFMLRDDKKFNYYFGERWLPGNRVVSVVKGEGSNVLILTNRGVGEIHFDPMTLEQKALMYEKQVRLRHIRYGFNCDLSALQNGDLSTFQMERHESDNLWTSMYLASQLFRYKVTGSKEALANCLESFEAMERLFDITGMSGYFARGFERKGYGVRSKGPAKGGMVDGWILAGEGQEMDWKGTTSSDQTVGQMFSLTLLAQYMDGDVKKRAVNLIDKLMTNIIENDWYLIDYDGKPTLWGKWNPEYVNGFPVSVGDRKLNSSNIIGFLQTAYHFTGKPIFKQKAYELMEKHGYLENLLRPMSEIGKAEPGSDDWAKMLSEGWNHSDDEMYFLVYWCLYPYAFDAGLKKKYKVAIQQHWELERPEKNGLWNLCYGMTGAKDFDLPETVWFLKEFPLDMIQWQVMNSHRKDIEMVEANFRGQTTKEVLPPDERPELKHNKNLFNLDRLSNGAAELSAGDSFLLPYWMGRFLGVISAPKQ
jgi:hypothetical protein